MRSARPRHGPSPQAGAPPCRRALRITATKSQVPSGRAAPAPARILVRWRSIPPPHMPPGRACGGKPASPVPLRSTAARPTGPRQPAGMLRTPPPVAAVFRSLRLPAHRAPGKPPHHPQRCDRGGASGGRRGESRICGSRPLHRACEEGASGERVSSRAELARAAAFGVAGSSGTFSTPDPYST